MENIIKKGAKKCTCECKKCKSLFTYKPEDTYWDDKGYGYSTKLVKCKNCNTPNVVRHKKDYRFSMLNTDNRYF